MLKNKGYNFQNRGYSLMELGVCEYAYEYNDVMEYINWLEKEQLVILGGDVYLIDGKNFEITYDNWYYQSEQSTHDSQQSIIKAKNYIENYVKNNGMQYVFSVVV